MYQKLVLFSGFIFSLLFHGALYYWLSGDIQVISAKSAKQSSTVISLCVPAPKEVKKEIEPKPEKPKKKPKSKPKKKPNPKPKPIPKPIPAPKKIPNPKPIEEKKVLEEEIVEELSKEENVELQKKEKTLEQDSSGSKQIAESQISTDELEAQKNVFLQELRETIKRNKIYPRIARVRAIQGEVSLVFYVLSDGSLVNVDIISGRKMFHKAIKKAIEKSSPIVNAPDIFTYPLEVSLKISFRLK